MFNLSNCVFRFLANCPPTPKDAVVAFRKTAKGWQCFLLPHLSQGERAPEANLP
jgi:hypothetical protein